MEPAKAEDFYEEDESVSEVFAAFDRGVKGVTAYPGLLPCIVCGAELEPAFKDSTAVNQPYRGTVFYTHGQYGSTVFDEMGREKLEITVCDRCMVKKAEEGTILHSTIVKYEQPVFKVRLWKGPHEEGKEEDEGNEVS